VLKYTGFVWCVESRRMVATMYNQGRRGAGGGGIKRSNWKKAGDFIRIEIFVEYT